MTDYETVIESLGLLASMVDFDDYENGRGFAPEDTNIGVGLAYSATRRPLTTCQQTTAVALLQPYRSVLQEKGLDLPTLATYQVHEGPGPKLSRIQVPAHVEEWHTLAPMVTLRYDRSWSWLETGGKPEVKRREALRKAGFRWHREKMQYYCARLVPQEVVVAILFGE